MVVIFTKIVVSMLNPIHQKSRDYHGDDREIEQSVYIKFGDVDADFLTSYYRDELLSKGIDTDYKMRLADYSKRKSNLLQYRKCSKKLFWFWFS